MEETVLVPSPSWFQPSILAASKDGWLVYGGPGKTLVVLQPLPLEHEGLIKSNHRFKSHLFYKAHKERIVSVDISPEWPEKRHLITGSFDGVVREWALIEVDNQLSAKTLHTHEFHFQEKENVVAAGYSTNTQVISIGSFSNIVLWELNSNVIKTFNLFLKSFKATCLSCSPHMPLVVAVGTKQGVVFVLDLNGNGKGKIIYKVRGQDDEVCQISWCPQYEVVLKRSLQEVRKSLVTQRMEQIRNQRDPEDLEVSATGKNLPEDSFDESIVKEDDTFDIYKDHEADEFGHKKYQPEDIYVKVKNDSKQDDFLAECMKLKAQILKNKNAEEESIESLVEAMDKAHVDPSSSQSTEGGPKLSGRAITGEASLGEESKESGGASVHVHKHLLASIGKMGSVRIWSKTGKIVATCLVSPGKHKPGQPVVHKGHHLTSICWHKPNSLLITDGKMKIFECNPLKIDILNKLEYAPVHSLHRRGLFTIITNAPRVQTAEMLSDPDCDKDWVVWSVAQDRYLIKYDIEKREMLASYATCGGFLYNISPCPYDAGKFAVGVGDGAIRVWKTHTCEDDESKVVPGEIQSYWQNVMGKVLQCVWHPTVENLIAFSTAESRVGTIDISSNKSQVAASVLPPALSCGVYSLAWGSGMSLFAIGGGELVMYQADAPKKAPIPIKIEIDGQYWPASVVNYSHRGMMIGSTVGGVAMFTGPAGHALAAKFIFTKIIHDMVWHPQHTSSCNEESQYQDLVAVSALDRSSNIIILKYEDKEGGGKQFSDFMTLTGHTNSVLQLNWSPHEDGQLLSTSHDATVRIWNALSGSCTSIFPGHTSGTMGAAWSPWPGAPRHVLSGGADFCLRVWDAALYPPTELPPMTRQKREKKPKKAIQQKQNEDEKSERQALDEDFDNLAEVQKCTKPGRRFLLPKITRQFAKITTNALTLMLQKHMENKTVTEVLEKANETEPLLDMDYLKLFGTINEVNELLDIECSNHLEQQNYGAYIMLLLFRGHIDTAIQFANKRDLLDTFLLSIAPCVSFKYWKDVTQLYVAQLDRLAAMNPEDRPYEVSYGGSLVYRKTAALLSSHEVRAAVEVLTAGNLYREAYLLCRCRHMDSIAEEVLQRWAYDAGYTGHLVEGALCHIVRGHLSHAACTLRRSKQVDCLSVALDLAKVTGLNTFADFIETSSKAAEKKPMDLQTEEILQELPSRMELLLKEKSRNGDSSETFPNGASKTEENGNDVVNSKSELPKSHAENGNVEISSEALN